MSPETTQSSSSATAAAAPGAQATYPARVEFDMPSKQNRALALVSIIAIRILLLLPHLVVLYIVQLLAFLVAWINMWAVLFTGHSSEGMHKFVAGSLRWSTRVSSYMYGLNDKYPPFSLN